MRYPLVANGLRSLGPLETGGLSMDAFEERLHEQVYILCTYVYNCNQSDVYANFRSLPSFIPTTNPSLFRLYNTNMWNTTRVCMHAIKREQVEALQREYNELLTERSEQEAVLHDIRTTPLLLNAVFRSEEEANNA